MPGQFRRLRKCSPERKGFNQTHPVTRKFTTLTFRWTRSKNTFARKRVSHCTHLSPTHSVQQCQLPSVWYLSISTHTKRWRFIVWYLARSATHPTSHNYPWSQDLFTHKPSQLPGEHTARLPFPVHRTIPTHKPSLSYQVPTYSWVLRVHMWAKCLA